MITIDWGNLIINVPKSYMSLVQASPFEVRQLDVNQFRLDLRALEASEDGMPFPSTHNHNTEKILSGISYARIVEIINGYTVEFEDGQYGVTLYGANNNILDVKVANQVSLLANNSAGLINSEALNNQSFLLGRVWINKTSGNPGTAYDLGTPSNPSDNWIDADTISTQSKLQDFHLKGIMDMNTEGGNVLAGHDFYGSTSFSSRLQLDGRDNTFSAFNQIELSGVNNGEATFRDCFLANPTTDLTNFQGEALSCKFYGKIALASSSTRPIGFDKCISAIAGTGKPEVDCNSTTADVWFRNQRGGLKITNFDGGGSMSVDIDGRLEIDSTCTAGTIVVGGTVEVIDNSGPGCNIIIASTVEELVWNKEGCV